MRFGSICSGIGVPEYVWGQRGWTCAFTSEIADFPREVLKQRLGAGAHGPPLHGDFTTITGDEYGEIDLLVGGTPCPDFSFNGARRGLADPRGHLALEYVALAGRMRPRWWVWENVAGVLSSNSGRDLGTILRRLEECGYGWSYRILDTQYIRARGYERALPHRRRRLFVVGYLGDWRPAAAVLFDSQSLSRHPPPSRKAPQDVAPTIGARASSGGGLGTDAEAGGALVAQPVANCMTSHIRFDQAGEEAYLVAAFGGGNTREIDAAPALQAHHSHRGDFETDGFLVAFTGNDWGADVGEVSPTLRAGSPGESRPNAGIVPVVVYDQPTWTVRRFTPVETERLMGLEDNWTQIRWLGKPASQCPVGLRHRCIGNAMPANTMDWLQYRIQLVEDQL